MPDYVRWLRSKVGSRKIILPYATALIRDSAGRLLLQRRSDFEWWGLPGGVLELGESFAECAARETLEETGLIVTPGRLVGVYTSPDYDVHYPNGDEAQQFTVAIECQVAGGHDRPDGVEIIENRFFTAESIASLHLPGWYADMARHCFEGTPPYFDPPLTQPIAEEGWRELRRLTGPGRLIAVGVGGIIQNEAGQVLLTLRREGARWGIPAGLMELGETAAGTLVREAHEELNAEVAVRALIGVFTGPATFHTHPDGNQVQIVSTLFRADLLNTDLRPDGHETLDANWFAPQALPEAMVERHRRLVEAALINRAA